MVAGLLISCGKSIEKDAKTIADFKCLRFSSHGDQRDKYDSEINKITSKYSGEDLAKLETLAKELFEKNCQEKIKEDKEMEAYEKEINDFTDSLNTPYDFEKSTSSINNDYDKMLNDYENYVDQYLIVYKKAMNGDQTAMIEYPELLSKAEELQKSMQLADRGGDLSTQQLKRMNDINFKMLNAMQN